MKIKKHENFPVYSNAFVTIETISARHYQGAYYNTV